MTDITGIVRGSIVTCIFEGFGSSRATPTLHVSPTDTLVTKVLLGTLGCIPAYDTFFINGVTCWSGITYPVMKLADMYFWSLGYQLRTLNAHQSRKR